MIARLAGRMSLVHDALLATLIAVRPLIWDEDPTQPSCCCYLVLLALALVALAVDAGCGLRRQWRWSRRGLLLAALVGWFAWEALRSPLPLQAWQVWISLASDLVLAWYLMQVMPGRGRLAVAALGAGLFTELVLAQLQWCWVLPALAQAQREGQLDIPSYLASAAAERIRFWQGLRHLHPGR